MKSRFLCIVVVATVFCVSCSNKEQSGGTSLTVITSDVSGITSTTATCGGNVTSDGGASVVSRGVVWDTVSNPTVELTTKTDDGSGVGTFVSSITGLTKLTTYYVRAYAINSAGISYGEQKTFKTDTVDAALPSVKTSEVSSITETSAICGGTVESEGSSSVSARGVVWSTSENPTVELTTKTRDSTGLGNFSSNITGLVTGTVYFVRAYATNEKGTSYGEQRSFKTKIDAVYECVDLGLSVKWATFNVGADSPEGLGDFFAWGEVQPYYADGYSQKSGSTVMWRDFTTGAGNNPRANMDGYAWENYSKGGIGSFVEWDTAPYDASVLILNSDRDAATVSWGNQWRIPTQEECTELADTAKTVWTWQTSPAGYVITSKVPGYEGKSIFLPKSGTREGTEFAIDESTCNYWSSSRCSIRAAGAEEFCIMTNWKGISTMERYYGLPIRPVSGERQLTPWVHTYPSDTLELISYNSAAYNGEVTSDSGFPVTARGMVWSKSSKPTVELSDKTVDGSGTGRFYSKITGLDENTIYYIRAYATNAKGTSYGEEKVFRTEGKDGTVEFVDLGLSVNWASYNLGGTKPADCGDYFAWAEVKPYYMDGHSQDSPCHDWRDYTTGGGQNPSLKAEGYTWKTYDGEKFFQEWANVPYDQSGILLSAYDAASEKRGGDWRMPTEEELEELVKNCSCIYAIRSGVHGVKLTSTKEGYRNASIFLPAAGYRDSAVLKRTPHHTRGGDGLYWASARDPWGLSSAYALGVWIDYERSYAYIYPDDTCDRSRGCTIRPVIGKRTLPSVNTSDVSSITMSSAICGGDVISEGQSSVTAKGVVWSTSENPTVELTTKTNDGSGPGSFTSTVSGLAAGTQYYVRAYATSSKGTSYGVQKVFQTATHEQSGTAEGMGKIDYEW